MSTTIVFKRQRVIQDDLMDRNYDNYIQSDEWKERVRKAGEEVDWICQLCYKDVRGSGGGTLHHINYNNLFNEQEQDLIFIHNIDCHIYR